MQGARNKVLILSSPPSSNAGPPVNAGLVECLRQNADVSMTSTIYEAIEALRRDHYDAIFTDTGDFLPLERALVSQQANLILNTIGEGVSIIDGEGRCNWRNKRMQLWPPHVHEKVRRTCQEAFHLFSQQVTTPTAADPPTYNRSKRYSLNIEDQQFMEMIASPVISPSGQVVQVVAVVWDATSTRRLQQKIDAIDNAGRELVRLEADALTKLDVGQRLKLLEDKIIRYTRDLMHFDHFAIRLLDRRTNKLELVICVGLPPEAMAVELFAEKENNGISGYVAAKGESYICPNIENDRRYVCGLDQARSSLTVPLRLHDKVIGIFNIESRQVGAFDEDDRQFAEIFGRYVAVALNILDLLIGERVSVVHKVADDVCAEAAGPLNDIALDASSLMDEYIGHDDLRAKLQAIIQNVTAVRRCLRQVADGPEKTILGADDVKETTDPLLGGIEVLVADDEPNIRDTIREVMHKYHAHVTVVANGADAIVRLKQSEFDLILSDIRMPDKTGYDVFAAARKCRPNTPVILMTGFGYDPNHSIVRASQEGLSTVLYKPFKVEQLLNEIRKALQSRSTPAKV